MKQIHTIIIYLFLAAGIFTIVPTSNADARRGRKKARVELERIGDISWQVGLGSYIFGFSNATGDNVSELIGERSVDAFLGLQYGYHMSRKLVLLASFDFVSEIDTIAGARWKLIGGLGARYNINKYLFVDGLVLIRVPIRSSIRADFGGLANGYGVNIPVHHRIHLVGLVRIPFNFVDGFQIGLSAFIGLQIYN